MDSGLIVLMILGFIVLIIIASLLYSFFTREQNFLHGFVGNSQVWWHALWGPSGTEKKLV